MRAVKRLRLEKGWSQKDLAVKSGVGQDTISGVESGKHEPRPSTLRKLAGALDTEVSNLFSEELTAPKGAARFHFPELPGLMAARSRRGFSPNELAARSGVSPEEIAELEAGTREADEDILDRLTAALAATPGELGFPPETYAAFLEADERDNARLRQAVAELSPSELRVLLNSTQLKSPGFQKVRAALNEESPDRGNEKRPEVG